ncbi:CAP domain-containing protein, partial [Pseudolysinimonas sp.]|uniref:CAP domain-containing protein n=1 Tax=Pseudolysinimonas sp. TaxID=2680009 RepID=UPI00286B23B2
MSSVTRTDTPSRARILVAVAITAIATILALLAPPASQAATGVPTLAQMMQRVVDDTNAVRSEAGLPGLVRNADLDRVAAAWARQQWENGAMSHNPNYSTQIPPGWQRAGENVAKGYSYTQVVPAWKASPSHYSNLVNDYTSIGIGYFEQDGRRYWSQVFAKYPGVAQPAPAPAQPAPTPTASSRPTPAPTATPAPSPAAEPAAPAGVAIALSSPSFESGLGSWSAPSGTVSGPNSSARGGVRSLLVPGASGRTIVQTVATTVAAGSTHAFTVWLRADGTATGTVRLRTVGGTGTEVGSVNFTASSSGWLKVSVTLTAKSAHTGFRLEVVTSGSGRTYRVDSASLVRTREPATSTAPVPTTAPA